MTALRKLLHLMMPAAIAAGLLISVSCAAPSFRVIPAAPAYLLRAPDGVETTFSEILPRFNGFEPRRDWMDLRPDMELRIENAYYRAGATRHGLAGFLGTEVAFFKVQSDGKLQVLSVKSMKRRPRDQKPVQQLVPVFQRRYRYHRFYYELFFGRGGNARGSVLLGANTKEELEHLAASLVASPRAVCGTNSANCTIFPEECTVSMEMQIVVNGVPQNVAWDSDLAGIVDRLQHIELMRHYRGRLTQVKLNSRDPHALQLPLLPGDHVEWR